MLRAWAQDIRAVRWATTPRSHSRICESYVIVSPARYLETAWPTPACFSRSPALHYHHPLGTSEQRALSFAIANPACNPKDQDPEIALRYSMEEVQMPAVAAPPTLAAAPPTSGLVKFAKDSFAGTAGE